MNEQIERFTASASAAKDEDSGGCSRIDIEISAALAAAGEK